MGIGLQLKILVRKPVSPCQRTCVQALGLAPDPSFQANVDSEVSSSWALAIYLRDLDCVSSSWLG